MKTLKASIIIRTKNEERWIGHCLKAVFAQTVKDLEVILVDSGSTDGTIAVAKRYPIAEIVNLNEFKPGYAINAGIRKSKGEFLVCLSAHCVPQNDRWLENLLKGFDDAAVAGIYGRQLPLSFSEASDKRDLLITFGLDRRVQVKDYFFHNANSAIRRKIWEAVPFDEAATNIEDRIWGKAVVEKGYKLVYEPEAPVYHHHGIHQDNNPERAKSTVSVLERCDRELATALPDFLKAESTNVAAIVPVMGEIKKVDGHDLLEDLIKNLKASRHVKSVHVLSELPEAEALAKKIGVRFIKRPEELLSKDKTIEDVLQYALAAIEKTGDFPQIILNANYLHPFRPKRLFDELIEDLQEKGLDTVFAGYTDYQNVWVNDPKAGFTQVGEGLKTRQTKQPLYESLYGVGVASASHVIRSKKLVGERIGILALSDRIYTLKVVDERSAKLVAAAFRHLGEADYA